MFEMNIMTDGFIKLNGPVEFSFAVFHYVSADKSTLIDEEGK